jgi:hypothetical protein
VSDGYVVEVKRSARKVSPGAGRWVREHGARREFDTKQLARQWARIMSPPGRTVWVQNAAPWDQSPVDGYVVGGRRNAPRRNPEPGEQDSLPVAVGDGGDGGIQHDG